MFQTKDTSSTFIIFSLLLAASLDQSYAAAPRKKLQAALERTAESNLLPWTQRQQAGRSPFTTADVDAMWAKHNRSAVRFFLRNGEWTMNGSADWYPGLQRSLQGRGGEVHELLIDLHAKMGLPDGLDLVWNLYDIPLIPATSQAYQQPPLFSMCSREGYADVPGISGGAFLFRFPTFNRSEVLARHPWKTRSNKAFWRGSPTGGNFSLDTWRDHVTFHLDTWPQYRRPQLVNLSQQHPDLLDAKFPSCVQCAPGVFEQMQKQLGQPEKVEWPSPDDLMSHKYIVDLDGNGWTERFLGQLAQQTAILKRHR
ncbi:hypothetical protein WJX73_006056 [Symbiochloris irregularis]|uniref:Glycosyl transferase CAP10 domain-containing protein n=1 Tax=Symbiochloris irregularis TaxID=706552 RepID=A0AAW1P1J1_9CHLO